MKTVSARTAKAFLGSVLTAARKEPVTILQDGVPVAVVVSPEDYLLLETLENAYLEQAENTFTAESIKNLQSAGPPRPAPARQAAALPEPSSR